MAAYFASFTVSAFLTGCGETNPQPPAQPSNPAAVSEVNAAVSADPDDLPIKEADVKRPADFPAALTRIKGYRDTIRDEIAAGRPTKAHRALDELDIVLNWLPEVARDSSVPKEQWETVNTTAQQIRELFNKVHTKIDAKQNPDYSSVSKAIDQSIKQLDEVAGTVPATKG
ncbi:hypothetical protein V5E97_39600 [Singulisphaera sp. Ch08]|uniref:Lipoprotein n=1 Tax=Singulisphaera sp. Ch08 TaxID=3120278 RepID=A0AAU7CH01_9BACT